MSSFGPKRKARKIAVDDADETGQQNTPATQTSSTAPVVDTKHTFTKFSKRPLKHSSLRKSTNATDSDLDDRRQDGSSKDDDERDDGPVVIKPAVSRSSSLRGRKKRVGSGRLSFGPGEEDTAEGEGDAHVVSTPKKGLGLSHKAIVNSAARNLPLRAAAFTGGDEGPRYSREYLAELQSSTPNTPARRPASGSDAGNDDDDDDGMELDDSELEGAMVVNVTTSPSASMLLSRSVEEEGTRILTQAEIEEKKARRAKLALLADAPDAEDYISLSDRVSSKKENTRLVREDEDLGEGFDEFVEDGGIALGKKAEREARRRQRREMREMIEQAEDAESEEDESEVERIAMFEDAQTRAGMEGVKQKEKDAEKPVAGYYPVPPPKITPIPDVGECLARLRATLKAMEEDVKQREERLEGWRREQLEIEEREEELQKKLAEAGETYGKLLGGLKGAAPDASPLRSLPHSMGLMEQRGLESFGNTPVRKPGGVEDDEESKNEDADEEMAGT